MPTITLSKKELLATLGKKLSDEELADRISMLGTDLEGINDDEITVEIFPNRPDLLSQQGFGRALASFIGAPGKTGLAKFSIDKPQITVTINKSTEDCRPYTACAVVRGLKLSEQKIEEIIMIQEKLHITYGRNRKKVAIGIYPLEHITPPIRFVGLAPEKIKFQPLEARREMTAQQILEDHPKGKEYAGLVKGLKHYACFLDGKDKIMSMTPIINSELTGKVSNNTTDVFVECSGFDYGVVSTCLNMIVTSFADMGGTIEACTLKYEHGKLGTITSPDLTPKEWDINLTYVNKVLGLELEEKTLKTLLAKMGFGYDEKKKKVLVPAYRNDILHMVDFVEDIAIAYGYENFTPKIPTVATVGEESWKSKIARKVREILVGHGLLEMKNYHLVNAEDQELMGVHEYVKLKSCVSQEYNTLRRTPLVSLLKALTRNQHHEYPQRVFEIGRGFKAKETGEGVEEQEFLAVLLAGEEENYTTARQILDSIAQGMNIQPSFEEAEKPWAIDGRCAHVLLNDEVVGDIAEIHPRVLAALGLEMPCSAIILKLSVF